MQPLPSEWIDSLFARLAVRYGTSWLSKWNGLDIAAVKADWAEELGGFASNPGAIRYALEHLPVDFPPNVAQFRALCIDRPEPKLKALPAPDVPDEKVAAEVAKARLSVQSRPDRAWAHAMQERDRRGDRLTITQRTMYRAALGETAS